MPSNPLNRPLKKIKPPTKPVTHRQVQFLAQKNKDQKTMKKTLDRIKAQGETSVPNEHPPPPSNVHYTDLGDDECIEHLPQSNEFDDFTSSPDDVEDNTQWSDIDDDEDDVEVISGLKRLHHIGRRMRLELQWAEQCKSMMPAFLRCRELTTNWSNRVCWDHDYKEPCSCLPHQQRVRWVDIVDLHGKLTIVDFGFLKNN